MKHKSNKSDSEDPRQLRPITIKRLEEALHHLTGLPMWSSGRAANLQWFQLGERRTVQDLHGLKEVGQFALHVQCAWRIAGPEGIIVASRDMYYPAGDPVTEPPNFQWDKPGANRCDERIDELFNARAENPLIVESISADPVGGIILNLSDAHKLEVFPDDSLPDEHWRLFQPYTKQPHFVVSGEGMSWE